MATEAPTLNVEVRGDEGAPAVLLLHGLLGMGRNLTRLAEGLSQEGYRTITYDQRGHGRSPWADDYRIEAFAQDALKVLTDLGIQRAHLVGHSMGGRVALAVTATAPQRVRTLTLLDVGPTISTGALDEIHRIMDPLPPFFENKTKAGEFISAYPAAIGQFLNMNLRKTGPEQTAGGSPEMHWAFDLKGLRHFLGNGIRLDQSETLRQWKGPALMLRGEKSRHLTVADTDEAKKLKSDIRIGVVPGAHHWLHADNLPDTLRTIRDFLKEHP